MISLKEAKSIVKKRISILGGERVDIEHVEGMTLKENIIATFPSPRFDNSAMDGFAVRAIDIKKATFHNQIKLKIKGISSAGLPSDIVIRPGECIQCMTGAKIPSGADAAGRGLAH